MKLSSKQLIKLAMFIQDIERDVGDDMFNYLLEYEVEFLSNGDMVTIWDDPMSGSEYVWKIDIDLDGNPKIVSRRER